MTRTTLLYGCYLGILLGTATIPTRGWAAPGDAHPEWKGMADEVVKACKEEKKIKIIVDYIQTQTTSAHLGSYGPGMTKYFDEYLQTKEVIDVKSDYMLEGKITSTAKGVEQFVHVTLEIVHRVERTTIWKKVIKCGDPGAPQREEAIPPIPGPGAGTGKAPVVPVPAIDPQPKIPELPNDFVLEIFKNKDTEAALLIKKLNCPFVEVKLGDTYRVKLTNKSKYDAVAELKVDGLNVIADFPPPNGKDPWNGNPPRFFVVRKNTSIEVPGWVACTELSHRFEIGAYPESVAGLKGAKECTVGVVTADFRYAWQGKDRPAEYPKLMGGGNVGTKAGEKVEVKYQVQPWSMDEKAVAHLGIRYARP